MKILFVCTGNTCRSPMAQALAQKIFKDMNIKAQVSSAGIGANPFDSASQNSILAMKNYDIDISNHKSKQITKEIIDENDFILTMTDAHKKFLCNKFDQAKGKIFTLSEFACNDNYDIIDPFGADFEIYKKCADQIFSLINIIAMNFKRGGDKK